MRQIRLLINKPAAMRFIEIQICLLRRWGIVLLLLPLFLILPNLIITNIK